MQNISKTLKLVFRKLLGATPNITDDKQIQELIHDGYFNRV